MPIEGDPFQEIRFKRKTRKYFVIDMGIPRFNEVDSYQVMWNGHYVSYFEEGRLALCRYTGFDLEKLLELGCYLPVYKYEVQMRKPILANDQIRVAVTANQLTDSMIEFEHLMLVGDEVRASGMVQHIPMDKETKKMMFQLPKPVRDILQPMHDLFF